MTGTSRRHILITDSDRDTREIFGAVLMHAGFAVEEACNAEQVLRAIHERPPAILILAVELPRPGGLRVLHLVREDRSAQDTRIIAVTSHVLPHEREVVESAGFDAVLYRPVYPFTVVWVVRCLIAQAA